LGRKLCHCVAHSTRATNAFYYQIVDIRGRAQKVFLCSAKSKYHYREGFESSFIVCCSHDYNNALSKQVKYQRILKRSAFRNPKPESVNGSGELSNSAISVIKELPEVVTQLRKEWFRMVKGPMQDGETFCLFAG
jgi:hypothetical protein